MSEHEPVVGQTGLLRGGDRMVMVTVMSVASTAGGTGADRGGGEQSDRRNGGDAGPNETSRRGLHEVPFGGSGLYRIDRFGALDT